MGLMEWIRSNQTLVENVGNVIILFLVAVGIIIMLILTIVNLIKGDMKKAIGKFLIAIAIGVIGALGYQQFNSFIKSISPHNEVFSTDAGDVIETEESSLAALTIEDEKLGT